MKSRLSFGLYYPCQCLLRQTSTRTGSYLLEASYTRQSSTTINGKTHYSTTENGTTTIVGPNGVERTRTRIR